MNSSRCHRLMCEFESDWQIDLDVRKLHELVRPVLPPVVGLHIEDAHVTRC